MVNPSWVDVILKLEKESKEAKRIKLSKKRIQDSDSSKKIILSNKEEGLLWFEMLKSLSKLSENKEIIPFTKYFEVVCRKFSITKNKAWNCLFFLKEFGFISVIRCHGIRINYSLS